MESSEWMMDQLRAWMSMDHYQHTLELVGVLLAVYFYFQRAYKPKRGSAKMLTEAEIGKACAKWTSLPLATPPTPEASLAWERNKSFMKFGDAYVLKGGAGVIADVGDVHATINLASTNFAGLEGDPRIKDACTETMRDYGCGSCGPRGFYGTTDVHLKCEQRIAKFCGADTAILYSFGTATMSSVIPAFCKRGDVVICDEGLSFTAQAGCKLCRSDIRWFRHNDVEDLERILEETRKEDLKHPKRLKTQRRFIIVEALYSTSGDFAPMVDIIRLKNEYKFRLILDESNSMGVMGKSGHGCCEELGISRKEVDCTIVDLAMSFGTIGGFCIGDLFVVDHQRLSGVGYIYSASQPPYLATAAIKAMDLIDEEGAERVRRLRKLSKSFRQELIKGADDNFVVKGDLFSPIVHIAFPADSAGLIEAQQRIFQMQAALLEAGVYVSAPIFVGTEHKIPEPTLRMSISASHDKDMLSRAAQIICCKFSEGECTRKETKR